MRLLRRIALGTGAAVLLTVSPAGAIEQRSNTEIRPNRGVGPVDVGDTKRAIERRLRQRGRRPQGALREVRRYTASGGGIDVFFRPEGKGCAVVFGSGRCRVGPRSKVWVVQTRSPVFSLGSITTATPFDEAADALTDTPWIALDCRDRADYAVLYRSRPGRATGFWYFAGQNAAVDIRSVGRRDGGLDESCPSLD